MTTLVAVFLPADATEQIARAAWDEAGYEEIPSLAAFLRPSKERRMIVGLQPWEHGAVLRTSSRLEPALLDVLARQVLARGGELLSIESEVEASWLREWDGDRMREREIPSPDWAPKERNREEPGERIAAWQLEAIAQQRLGARRRGEVVLHFRARPVALVDVVRGAIAGGSQVTEVVHAGRVGFRVATPDGARTVFLTDDETADVRARLAAR